MLKHSVGATLTEAFFMIFEEKKDLEQGYRLYIIYQLSSIACPTRYFLGHDHEAAQLYVNDLNLRLGISPAEVEAIYEYITGLDQFAFHEV